MIRISINCLFLFYLLCSSFVNGLEGQEDNSKSVHSKSDLWLHYSGSDGPGKGKHVVLIAAEQFYCTDAGPVDPIQGQRKAA